MGWSYSYMEDVTARNVGQINPCWLNVCHLNINRLSTAIASSYFSIPLLNHKPLATGHNLGFTSEYACEFLEHSLLTNHKQLLCSDFPI